MSAVAQYFANTSTNSADWISVLRSIQNQLDRSVALCSEAYDISPFDLKLRVLLHLPRFEPRELENLRVLRDETDRIAARTVELQREFKAWASQEAVSKFERTGASVVEASPDIATVIHERFHYIGSRREGRHFALYFAGREIPAALLTLSEMDVEKIKGHLPISSWNQHLLLSRLFSFRWAPKNTISYLLGKVGQQLREEGQVDFISTWVNPNLGFNASSYRAANWTYLASEPATYRYVRGDYQSFRALFCGGQNTSLKPDAAKVRLAPLQIWLYRVAKCRLKRQSQASTT